VADLTAEQTKQMDEISAQWAIPGDATGPIDRDKARAYANDIYPALLAREKPKAILFASSPWQAWLMTLLGDELQEDKETIAKMGEKDVADFIGEQLSKKTEGEIVNEFQVTFIWPYFEGQFYASYAAYLETCRTVLKVGTFPDVYPKLLEQVAFGPLYTLNQMCIITERPKELHVVNKMLHNSHGPAIAYEDFELYVLHNIPVDKELVETPLRDLDVAKWLQNPNVEVRRELLRLHGIDVLLPRLPHKVLDKQGDYTLYEIDLGAPVGKWPALRMKNPSIGVWHLEWVNRGIATVAAALAWRNQTELTPSILT